MKLDRRQFIQIGAIAAFAGSGCNKSKPKAPSSTGGGGILQIDFDGLYVIEEKGSSMVVHLIDGPAVGLPEHFAELFTNAATLDQANTAPPTRIQSAGTDIIWHWDLKGMAVTGPASSSADLTEDQSSSEDGLDLPTSDAGWHSLARVPNLRELCGATKITQYDKFTSSITLSHGHMGVLKPVDPIGSTVVWVFKNPSGNQLVRRAFSNRVRYTCPANGAATTVQIGSQQIVFKPGAGAQVSLQNLPKNKMPNCGTGCVPNMNHFGAFAKIVDAQFTPTITLAAPFMPVASQQAGADYCPGSRI